MPDEPKPTGVGGPRLVYDAAHNGGRGESSIAQAISNSLEPPERDGPKGGPRDAHRGRYDCTDLGNADRFYDRYGRDLCYAQELGRGVWVRTHWSFRDGPQQWALNAQKTARKITDEIAALEAERDAAPDDAEKEKIESRIKSLRKWRLQSGNMPRIEAMQRALEPRVQLPVEAFDADPFLFNVQNGTLELGSKRGNPTEVRLLRHARLDRITRIAPIGYDPEAQCPRFRAFLAQILPDKSVVLWVQKLLGYCLTGADSEHMFACFEGEGRNGKGTLTKLFLWVLGDYGRTIEFASLLADERRRGSEATPDLARLAGARAVVASEPPKGKRLDDGRIKQITGGDTSMVRHLNREFFDLRPTFKLILSFNNPPLITDDSHGMWTRLRLVPFKVIIPENQQDKHLLDKLKAEGPGVLNWLLDGFRLWREQGLEPPEAIVAATAKYRAESDIFGQFLKDATYPADPPARVKFADLYACYEGWCRAHEKRRITEAAFGKTLNKRGFEAQKSNSTAYRRGLLFRPDIDWEWHEAL